MNLEGTLGSGGTSKCGGGRPNCFAFQAPASYAGVFARAGFDVMNLGEQPCVRLRPERPGQTTAALGGTGSPTPAVPARSWLRRAGSRVAFVGFAPYPWARRLGDPAAAMRLVRTARRRADVVVVLMHAGAEGSGQTHTPHGDEFAFGENRGNPRAFAHAVVRRGRRPRRSAPARTCVRGIERYRGRLIAYSLGNFVGYRNFGIGPVTGTSALLTRAARPGRHVHVGQLCARCG